jgi:5-methyltetrahydrofolate--homocysteine methyltransferase
MSSLIERLSQNGPILLDGAWGTQLQARGLPVGACPDAWNLNQPGQVEEVARAYVEAGSQVILTNTFGASRIGLSRLHLADKAVEINRAGARISRNAADDKALVFASMGPSGAMLALEEVSEDQLRSTFKEQAEALAEGGVDAIVIETMIDLQEAAIAALAAMGTGLPVIVCMIFDPSVPSARTLMGVTVEQAASELEALGVSAIGTSCGWGPVLMVPACRRLRAATSLPLWIKPNAGLPRLIEGRAEYEMSPDEFTAAALSLVDCGANFIGGCCGTGPEHIRSLAAAVDHRAKSGRRGRDSNPRGF